MASLGADRDDVVISVPGTEIVGEQVLCRELGGRIPFSLDVDGSVKKRYQEYPSKATKGVRNIFVLCSRDQYKQRGGEGEMVKAVERIACFSLPARELGVDQGTRDVRVLETLRVWGLTEAGLRKAVIELGLTVECLIVCGGNAQILPSLYKADK